MSQSMFEIRRVFQQRRADINKVAEGFSMHSAVNQYGREQLIDSLQHLLNKEQKLDFRGVNLQHNPADFLQDVHEGRISPHVREEAVLVVLQFAVQTDCLDQTVLQAAHLADNYLRANATIQPAFVRIISAIALEISIKLNEQMVLQLEDVAKLFEDRFSVQMLAQLERHILQLNNFRVNVATPLDFCLHYAFLEKEALDTSPFVLPPEELVNMALPLLHYAISQYDISRKKYSSIAIAAICHVLQEVHDEMESENQGDGPQPTGQICQMQVCRDKFLASLLSKFPDQFDMDEIYEILRMFKEPFEKVAQGMHGSNEESKTVTKPWTFDYVVTLLAAQSDSMDFTENQQPTLQVSGQNSNTSLPNIAGLSLEQKESLKRQQMALGRKGDETPMQISTCESSRNFPNMGANSNPSKPILTESEESKGGGQKPNQLGRPSLSESTTGPTRQFPSPGFEKRSQRTNHAPSQGGCVDDENFFEDTEDPTNEEGTGNAMMKSIDQQHRDAYFSSKSNNSAIQVDGFQLAKNEQESDSSENESSYTSGGKRKEKRVGQIDKVPRKSIRKKPENPAKDKPPKPGGIDKKRHGSQEKKPLVD